MLRPEPVAPTHAAATRARARHARGRDRAESLATRDVDHARDDADHAVADDDTPLAREPRPDQPMPLDEQVAAMAGAPLGRLRRIPTARRRGAPGPQRAGEPATPLALSDFHDLRRLGLFGDDGRNPPPSWWAR